MDKLTLRVFRVEEEQFSGEIWGYRIYLGSHSRISDAGLQLVAPILLFCKEKEVADKFPLGSNVVLSIQGEK